MGVWYLHSFIESHESLKQSVSVEVDLRDLAHHWRKKGRRPVLVADGNSISRKFRTDYDLILGGEYKSMIENIYKFIDAFKVIGVDVVFFIGGGYDYLMASKLKKDAFKRIKTKIEIRDTFRSIQERPVLQHVNEVCPVLFTKVFREAIAAKGQFVRVRSDVYKHMLQYAISNDCVGILTDNTSHFVYEAGVLPVFSGKSLNVSNLTTIKFVREPLLEALGLPGAAMPIFAILMGNDDVSREDTLAYHWWKFGKNAHLRDGYVTEKARALAEVANKMHERSQSPDYSTYAANAAFLLAEEMFDIGDRESKMVLLLQSLLKYRISAEEPGPTVELPDKSDWEAIQRYCEQNYSSFRHGRMSAAVILHRVYRHKAVLEKTGPHGDRSQSYICNGLCCAHVLAEQRKRIYGVLLFERNNGETVSVEEIFTSGCRDPLLYYLRSSTPIPSDIKHPGLYRLWSEDEALDPTRWTLLLWILSTSEYRLSDDDVAAFRDPSYQPHFAVVGLVLLYLYKVLRVITRKELEVLLVMTSGVPEMNASELRQRRVDYLKKRAVFVSTCFQYTCVAVLWVLKVCNINIFATKYNLYSGFFFHYLFTQAHPRNLLDELQPQATANYNALKAALNL